MKLGPIKSVGENRARHSRARRPGGQRSARPTLKLSDFNRTRHNPMNLGFLAAEFKGQIRRLPSVNLARGNCHQ